MKKLYAILCVLIIPACGSTSVKHYDGPVRSSSETATISLWTDASKIDEKLSPSELKIISSSLNGEDILTNNAISVLPGNYSFVARCTLLDYSKTATFEIAVEPDKNYAVIAVGKGNKCDFKKLSLVVDNARFVEL